MCLVPLLAAGCSDEPPPPPTPTPSPTATRTSEPPLIIIPLGRTATSDIAEITIHGSRVSRAEGDEQPPSDYAWLFFDLTVGNKGNEPFELYTHLIHPDGREFERDFPSAVESDFEALLEVGEEIRGEIAFLVERRTTGTILVYGPGGPRWALELGMPVEDER